MYDAASIAAALTARSFGRAVEYYPQIGSTNDRARELGQQGAPAGLLVVADEQLRGRGRRGRSWIAPPGGAILASLLLRPRTPLAEAFAPTMIMGLAVYAAARSWGAPATLKWPNDLLCRGRKMAGILCEAVIATSRVEFIVAGFGVNVDFDPAAVGLGDLATSLSREIAGPPPDRLALLDRILVEAENRYTVWQVGGYDEVWEEWQAALETMGRPVRIAQDDGTLLEGQALRVERDGALIVATPDSERRVLAGTILLS